MFNPRLLLSTVLWVQAYRISLSIHSLSVLPLLAVSEPLSLGIHLALSLYLGYSVSLCLLRRAHPSYYSKGQRVALIGAPVIVRGESDYWLVLVDGGRRLESS